MKTATYSPDAIDFVLGLLGAYDERRLRVRGAPSPSELVSALRFATLHGVSGCLAGGARRLQQTAPYWTQLLPFFQDVETRNREQNAKLKETTLSVLHVLAAAGVTGVALKGAAFLVDDSMSLSWRTLGDIDILVPTNNVVAAAHALIARGYRPDYDPSAYTDAYHHHYAPLRSAPDGIVVELHTRLLRDSYRTPVVAEEIFAKGRPSPTAPHALIPSPEHRMVHLIAHAQISDWGFVLNRVVLKDLVDAMALAERFTLDWAQIAHTFRLCGAEDAFEAFLCARLEIFGSDPSSPEPDGKGARRWGKCAAKSLYRPPTRAQAGVCILKHYIKAFATNPKRIGMIWETLKDPARWQLFLETNRRRLQ